MRADGGEAPMEAERDPFKLPFNVRQEVARKLAEAHGLTQMFALKLVNDTLRNLRGNAGVQGVDRG